MADVIPIKLHSPEPGLAEFESGDTIAIATGGTGATTSNDARLNLGAASQSDLNIVSTALAGKAPINHNHDSLYISKTPTLINSQPHIVFNDNTRTKILSTTMNNFLWAEAKINNNEWMQIGHAVDTQTGYIMPFKGTIVGVAVHCENTNGNSKDFRIYINGNEHVIGTLNSGNDVSLVDMSLNLDFSQGDKIRLRGGSGGTIEDTVVTVFTRWRA